MNAVEVHLSRLEQSLDDITETLTRMETKLLAILSSAEPITQSEAATHLEAMLDLKDEQSNVIDQIIEKTLEAP